MIRSIFRLIISAGYSRINKPEASDTDADHLGEILTAAAKSSGFSIQQIIKAATAAAKALSEEAAND